MSPVCQLNTKSKKTKQHQGQGWLTTPMQWEQHCLHLNTALTTELRPFAGESHGAKTLLILKKKQPILSCICNWAGEGGNSGMLMFKHERERWNQTVSRMKPFQFLLSQNLNKLLMFFNITATSWQLSSLIHHTLSWSQCYRNCLFLEAEPGFCEVPSAFWHQTNNRANIWFFLFTHPMWRKLTH